MPTIDRTTYQKATRPIGSGYDRRVKGVTPRKLVIHTTNGNRGSSFAAECRYCVNSNAIGIHYEIGKEGQIVEQLDPMWRAWHVGRSLPGWGNNDAIGVECHHAVGEAWTPAQHDALTWLTKEHLMPRYGITPAAIDTHRAVALPHGRKVDPSDWSDAWFYAWRAALSGLAYVPQPARLASYITTTAVNVRQGPSRAKPIALDGHCVLAKDFAFQSDVTVQGEAIGGNGTWVHLVVPAAWGFVHSSCVRRV